MTVRLQSVWLAVLLCFHYMSAAPRMSVPTLRSGGFATSEERNRNGRSLETNRWTVERVPLARDVRTVEPTTDKPIANSLGKLITAQSSSGSSSDKSKGSTNTAVREDAQQVSQITFEKQAHPISSTLVNKQEDSASYTPLTQELHVNNSSAFPSFVRKMRLSSVSMDPRKINISSYQSIKNKINNTQVPTINKKSSTPLPTFAGATLQPTASKIHKGVLTTQSSQSTSPRSSKVIPTVSKKVFPTQVVSVFKSTRPTSTTKAPSTNSTHLQVPSSILVVPNVDFDCEDGFQADEYGNCRETFS